MVYLTISLCYFSCSFVCLFHLCSNFLFFCQDRDFVKFFATLTKDKKIVTCFNSSNPWGRHSQTTIIFLLDGCKSVMQRWVCLDKNKLAGHKILHHLDSNLVSCIAHNWNPSESRMELMKTAKSYITTNHGWAESNMRLGNDYLRHTDSLLLTSSNTRTPRPSPSLQEQRKKRRWVDSYFSAWHGLVLKRQVPFSLQTLW